MLDGLYLIVVGTTDAVRTVVQTNTQIRSVFSDPQVLQPLALDDVQLLLANAAAGAAAAGRCTMRLRRDGAQRRWRALVLARQWAQHSSR